MSKDKNHAPAFNAETLSGFSAERLNMKLQEACANNWSADRVCLILDAFKDAGLINKETIVDAAELARVDMVNVLTAKIPAADAQDFYDRALIATSAYHLGTQGQYLAIAKTLLQRGANPEAHECSAQALASGYLDKDKIRDLLDDVIDAREKSRALRATAAEFKGKPFGNGPL